MPSIQDAIAQQRARVLPPRLQGFAQKHGREAAMQRYQKFLANALPGQRGGIQQGGPTPNPGDTPVSPGRPNGGVLVAPPLAQPHFRPPMDTSPPQIQGQGPIASKPMPGMGQPLPMPPQGIYGPNMTSGENPFGTHSAGGQTMEVGGMGGGVSQDGGGMGPMGGIPPALQMQAPPPSGPIFMGGGGYLGSPKDRIMRRRNQIAGINAGAQVGGGYTGG